jgi:transcriptional regulator with XRE-family HTH domain
MNNFSEIIRSIRIEAGLTQKEFAKKIKVSNVLIAMVETGQKEVSKKLILAVAKAIDVHPVSITPFLFMDKHYSAQKVSAIEKKLIDLGEKMQHYLIKKKAKNLKNYGKKALSKNFYKK